jgi:hypothetical protein
MLQPPVAMVQVVLCKPSGLQVMPAGVIQQRCVLTLLHQHADSASWPCAPAPVHRLGRGTSGAPFFWPPSASLCIVSAFTASVFSCEVSSSESHACE